MSQDKEEKTKKKDYRIGDIVPTSSVPTWARREHKYDELVERIGELEPGQTLTVIFSDRKAANRARTKVRDTLNLRKGLAAFRTRVIGEENEEATVYFTRLHNNEIVEKENPSKDE